MRDFLTIALVMFGTHVCLGLDAKSSPKAPCKSKAEILSDGKLRVTDCQGQHSLIDPSPAETGSASNQASGALTASSAKLAAAYEEFEVASLEYQKQQLARNLRVFAWQDTSSKVIFVIVSLLVLTGLALTGVQFRKASQIELSAGKEGLHLTTSIVGVVILAMSMLFLYLYLFFVYPIKELGR